MYKYIKNPVNNKKVNIHSKLGKNIIKKYLNFIIGGSGSLPPYPRNTDELIIVEPKEKADLYDLDPKDDNIKNLSNNYTFNKQDGDYNCKGNAYDKDKNCLIDPSNFECILKNDILQYTTRQCASRTAACNNRHRYNKNPLTNEPENTNFWQMQCPPPGIPTPPPPPHDVYFDNLNNVTIRKAVKTYKNNISSCPHIETWNVTHVTDMSSLFEDFSNFNGNITDWNTENVTNMSKMFSGATNFNQPLNFDTEMVTDMSGMFLGAISFDRPLEWNTENVTSMSEMFCDAKNFNQPLYWKTENVTNMSAMFQEAENFNESLNFSDTSNVTNMSSMFLDATSFDQPLEWDTQKVTNMSHMFYGAENFNKSLNFDTSQVTNMNSMFVGAISFDQPLKWDTQNVINMGHMFYGAEEFDQDLEWNTKNVINKNNMFSGSSGRLTNQ